MKCLKFNFVIFYLVRLSILYCLKLVLNIRTHGPGSLSLVYSTGSFEKTFENRSVYNVHIQLLLLRRVHVVRNRRLYVVLGEMVMEVSILESKKNRRREWETTSGIGKL